MNSDWVLRCKCQGVEVYISKPTGRAGRGAQRAVSAGTPGDTVGRRRFTRHCSGRFFHMLVLLPVFELRGDACVLRI